MTLAVKFAATAIGFAALGVWGHWLCEIKSPEPDPMQPYVHRRENLARISAAGLKEFECKTRLEELEQQVEAAHKRGECFFRGQHGSPAQGP